MGVGFPFLWLAGVVETEVSDAPEGFLDNFNDGGSGVLDPLDGVLVLKKISEFLVTRRYSGG